LAWCTLAIWLGPRIGYVDLPDDPTLKAHERPAVPLGGVGIFLGVHLAALATGELDLGLLLASTVVLVLGLVDDRRGVEPGTRLVVEIAAALILVLDLSGNPGLLFYLLAGALVVFAINAVNLFDGLDGLVGAVGLVTAVGLAGVAQGRGGDFVDALTLAAALAGFLVLNWHPARVFIGDAGAYFVGLYLANLVLEASDSPVELILTSGFLGVFAIDLLVTLLRRRLNKRPLFLGDRSHIYDQLRDRGMSVPTIALLAAATQAVLLVLVITAERLLGATWGLLTLVGVLAIFLALLARLGFLRVDEAHA
jgi:UDP-GlcNAc:undecaprenyl-phosphate/decaprenyl-phosphate GlcNAc-1-phosphate transferase